MSIFQITPTIQNYDWGKIGASSKVAQLASASKITGFSLADGKHYAEVVISLR
jgi:mannose-6-phosphate isomerase